MTDTTYQLTASDPEAKEAYSLLRANWVVSIADGTRFDLDAAAERLPWALRLAHCAWDGSTAYTIGFAEPVSAATAISYSVDSAAKLAAYIARWSDNFAYVMPGELD